MIIDVKCKTPDCPQPIEEVLIKRTDVDADGNYDLCPKCGAPRYRLMSNTSFKLVGKCWASDNYS